MGVYDGSGHAYHFYPGKTALAVSLLFRRLHLERAILTLLLDAHASTRGIQSCLRELFGWSVSLASIGTVIHDAEARAVACLERTVPTQPRALAVDELYGNAHDAAYLSVVDASGGAVWATAGPVAPDAESWTLVLWDAQARGLRWTATMHDGGPAAGAACTTVDPARVPGRDVWHVLHRCAVAQAHVDRAVATSSARWVKAATNEEARATGQRASGPLPKLTADAQAAIVTSTIRTAADLWYVTGEVRRVLGIVVAGRDGLLDAATRRAELDAALDLLGELSAQASADLRTRVDAVRTHLANALPGLLVFAVELDAVQRDIAVSLGAAGVALVGWAWRHRDVLGPEPEPLVHGFPPRWQPAARVLIAAWNGATRSSSLAETWHSVLRPHVAVHRTRSPGFLALIAVSHNHRVRSRGIHRGKTPLQVCGVPDAPVGWPAALGYTVPPPMPDSIAAAYARAA